MRFSVSAAAATAALAGVAVADPLTIINPCPAATSSSVHPITVTKQFQEVSTCAPTTACLRGSCTTKYPFETFAYVSTVIPAAWNGKNMEAATVTSTTQTVTVSRFQTTITKWVTPAPVIPKSGTIVTPKPTSIELTIAKDYFVPFNRLGGLAIPGFDGSGLCRECETQPDGSRSQVVGVVECRAGPGGSKCMGYDETWVSKAAPSTSATTASACSTRWTAPSAGTFTFTFPFTAPARTITAAETTITVGPVPYWAYVTRVCHRPNEVIDFTTTVTKTIFWTAPCSRQPPRTSSAVPVPTGNHAFPGWPRPGPNGGNTGNNGNTGGNNGVDGSKDDPYGWADWGSDDVADPSASIPSEWADWVATATTTAVTTKSSSISQSFTYTTGTHTLTTSGGVDGTSTSTSSFSFSHGGPTGYSTTASGLSSTTSTSSYSFSNGGPTGYSTTTSGLSSTTSTSSYSFSNGGPTGYSTTASGLSSTTSTSSYSSSHGGPGGETTTSGGYGSSTTYDHGTTTSTITSFTTTTVATTTSAPATTTSLVAIPVDPENFVIGVNTAGKYRKRALRYIKISGGDAVLVTEKDEASKFEFEGGYLKSGGLFVDADTTQPWLSFSLTATLNANISQWIIGADGSISLVAPNNGICVSADNSVFIQFSGNTPFQCAAIALVAEVPNPTTTTSVTTTTFVPTTSAEPTTTTTTVFDPSGDLDADIPAPTVVRRGVQYGGQRFGRSRRH